MYGTKPLSLFKSYPEAASEPPPEGQNSGYLVLDDAPDDDSCTDEACCWGTCCRTRVWELPFPQNRVLTVEYTKRSRTYSEDVVFVPVPDQPLASNRYYVVVAKGKHNKKGLVRTCSREGEEDVTLCCCCVQVKDAKPRPFDPTDVYQQMEVVPHRRGQFTARAVAADGIPCFFYGQKYWLVYFASKPKTFDLGLAQGINASLRSATKLAGAALPAATATTTTMATVGKWYCPFFLVKEGDVAPHGQMNRSVFYEVTLELRWEPVHALSAGGGSKLTSKKALIGGSVVARQESTGSSRRDDETYVWFRAPATRRRIGLCTSVWERMRWEEYRGGWVDEVDDAEKVAAGGGDSVLVERFVFKRMDGSVAVAFDFVHLNKMTGEKLQDTYSAYADC
ncbi:hypothetical protein PR202_gb03309 [Eleusine coracana subsp. coracana]|uniref:Uncharacterized protein n=1 Tax=Eleusine coracana subsp. coracana TaxID=191504 RepID=A0AAV5E0H2_ELECO|nr:hypothetical protein QOZ80_8BG0658740 [Eleusine coracana subsp. coracana]GJN16263.1 hypothetical protein PR202_gb03229 [Eleusine coracana subsp. coracana]GJN16332.1 hypothetical protein PR202_gb03309 [Eleusine coracana subsp. coracana]